MSLYDVPATELIDEVARDLSQKLEAPGFTEYVKSGAHNERAPLRGDWWHVRAASILYRVFRDGPLGTESLRTYYGGRKNRGVKPHRFSKASGKVIRSCLQALEKEGFIRKLKKGRTVSSKGQAYLEKSANKVKKRFDEVRKQAVAKEEAVVRERMQREEKAAAQLKVKLAAKEKAEKEMKEADAARAEERGYRRDSRGRGRFDDRGRGRGRDGRGQAPVKRTAPAEKEVKERAAQDKERAQEKKAKETSEKIKGKDGVKVVGNKKMKEEKK